MKTLLILLSFIPFICKGQLDSTWLFKFSDKHQLLIGDTLNIKDISWRATLIRIDTGYVIIPPDTQKNVWLDYKHNYPLYEHPYYIGCTPITDISVATDTFQCWFSQSLLKNSYMDSLWGIDSGDYVVEYKAKMVAKTNHGKLIVKDSLATIKALIETMKYSMEIIYKKQ